MFVAETYIGLYLNWYSFFARDFGGMDFDRFDFLWFLSLKSRYLYYLFPIYFDTHTRFCCTFTTVQIIFEAILLSIHMSWPLSSRRIISISYTMTMLCRSTPHTPGGICMSSAMCAAACVEVCTIIPINCSRRHTTVLGTILPGWFVQSYVCNYKERVLLFTKFSVSIVNQGLNRCEKTSGPVFYLPSSLLKLSQLWDPNFIFVIWSKLIFNLLVG